MQRLLKDKRFKNQLIHHVLLIPAVTQFIERNPWILVAKRRPKGVSLVSARPHPNVAVIRDLIPLKAIPQDRKPLLIQTFPCKINVSAKNAQAALKYPHAIRPGRMRTQQLDNPAFNDLMLFWHFVTAYTNAAV